MKKFFGSFAALLLIAAHSTPALSANLDVCPTCTYTTLNSAANAVNSGDIVRVAAGTYDGDFDYFGLNSANKTFSIQGGFDSSFTSRNGETIFSNVGVQVGPSFTGTATFDGITFTGYQGDAVYFASTGAHLVVNNCLFYDNGQYAIDVAPYAGPSGYEEQLSPTITLTHNTIHGHRSYGAINVNLTVPDPLSSNVTVSDNVIYDSTGIQAQGIRIQYLGNAGNIQILRNELYQNDVGIYYTMSGSAPNVEIAGNSIHDNRYKGIELWHSPDAGHAISVHNNVIYSNGIWGVYHYYAGDDLFYNNTIANHSRGIQLINNAGSPTFRNNIFYDQSLVDIYLTSDVAGSATSIVPASLTYNNFFHPSGGAKFDDRAFPFSYNGEIPGDSQDINQFAWSEGNFIEEPHFVDAANGNYHLSADSFCIDEADPAATYADEAAPQGNRLNLGAYGNTADSEHTGAAVVVSDLSAQQNGSGIQIGFNSTTSVGITWLNLEYWDGAAYQAIDPRQLDGTGYKVGYLGGRLPTGNGRSLTWNNTDSLFANSAINGTKIRLTAFHGGQTASVIESAGFNIDYVPPTVQMTSPTNGMYVSGSGPAITANASDSGGGVSSVVFRYKLQGAGSFSDLSTDAFAPYTSSWNGVTLVPGAAYVLQAVATDAAGNSATSADVNVTVCSYGVSSASASYNDAVHAGTFNVTTPGSSCPWTAQSNVGWITLTSGAAGSGTGAVGYSLEENTGIVTRSGTITAGGQTVTITQSGKGCSYSLSADTQSFGAAGGSGLLTVTALPSACTWSIDNNSSWINLGASSGSGSTTIGFTIASNALTQSRSATLSLQGHELAIAQDAAVMAPVHLILTTSGPGAVNVSPAATSCGNLCYTFTAGDTVTLDAGAINGATFGGWSGGCGGTAARCTLQLNSDTAVGAVFIPHPASLSSSAAAVNFSSKQKSKKISFVNRSGQTLVITGIYLSGSGTFKKSSMHLPLKLKSGKNKSLTISFKSKTKGTFSGSVFIHSNDPYQPVIEIPITATK